MTTLKLLGAAAIAASTLATPVMAQALIEQPDRCQAMFPNANCKTMGPGNPYTDGGYRQQRVTYRHAARVRDNDWNRTHTGFWPTDVATDVAGAAIGTAGAIATAPFRAWDNSYAYDNSWDNSYAWDSGYHGGPRYGWDNRSYAQRNGFVCTPGTYFRGQDGHRHICQ
jgi:hypothetical protein